MNSEDIIMVKELSEECRETLKLEQEKEKAVGTIKKCFRIKKSKEEITPSKYQTKEWRHDQEWWRGGQKNECELYQRGMVKTITKKECSKSNDRIQLDINKIIEETRPMKREDAFEWTEDFDGLQKYNGRDVYYNFKMVVGAGGAQTRSLREVSHFIKGQLDYNTYNINDIKYFVNILDGDESYKLIKKYDYILNKGKYKFVKNFVYIGDTYGFIDWFDQLNVQ